MKFLLGLAFLFVDGGELRRAGVLVDRLVDCLALVVVHSLVLGGTNLINTLEKSIMKRATRKGIMFLALKRPDASDIILTSLIKHKPPRRRLSHS